MINIKKATTGLLIALALILVLASPVSAGLVVTNAKIQDSVSPGESATYIMKVTDNTSESMDIAVEVRGLGNHITGPIEALTAENDLSPYSARQFITATPASFHLEPGQSQDVTVTLTVPGDVGDGGRYADILIYTIPPSGGGPIAVSVAVGAQALLTIEGSTPTITGDITSIDMLQAVSGQFLSVTPTIQNTGNYHYKLTCNGTVSDSLGQVVGTAWQTDSVYNLIPTFSQQIDVPLNISQELTPGIYNLSMNVYTQDGVWLDTEYKTFVLTASFTQPPLNPLKVEFHEEGQLSMYQWSMSEDGTLMENVDASSLSSSVSILIRQGTRVLWAEGQSEGSLIVMPIDPTPPAEYSIVGAYDFSPEGLTFDPAAYITFEYSPADIPEGVSETLLKVATVDEYLHWDFLEGDDVDVDPDANTITFPVEHFSVYALLAPTSAEAASGGAASRMWLWIVIGAICVVIAVFSINTFQHRRALAVRKERSRQRRSAKRPPSRGDDW